MLRTNRLQACMGINLASQLLMIMLRTDKQIEQALATTIQCKVNKELTNIENSSTQQEPNIKAHLTL